MINQRHNAFVGRKHPSSFRLASFPFDERLIPPLDISVRDVGLMPTKTLDDFMSVRGLRPNLHAWLAVDDRNDPLADERVTVDVQNADGTFHNYPVQR